MFIGGGEIGSKHGGRAPVIDTERPMIQQEIAKAVLAERERCAKIVDDKAKKWDVGHAKEIAEEIRKGE